MTNLNKYKRHEVLDYAPKQPSFLTPQNRCKPDQTKLLPKQAEWLRKNYSDCTDTELAMALWCDVELVQRYARNNYLQKSGKFQSWAKAHDPTKPVGPPRTHLETDEELIRRIRWEEQQDNTFAADYALTFDFATQEERCRIAGVIADAMRWAREH